MKSIVKDILRFYGEIDHGRLRWVARKLRALDIAIITGFLENIRWMEAFYRRYVEPFRPQVVICGINPGRHDSEKSARFFYSVVKHFGSERFYSTFYVTNVSRLGFTKGGRNINYYRLPEDIQAVILDQFIHEIDLVNPTHIISTGREVERTLASLKASDRIRTDIDLRLKHPRWCGIDRNRAAGFREYVDLLGRFIGPGMQQ